MAKGAKKALQLDAATCGRLRARLLQSPLSANEDTRRKILAGMHWVLARADQDPEAARRPHAGSSVLTATFLERDRRPEVRFHVQRSGPKAHL